MKNWLVALICLCLLLGAAVSVQGEGWHLDLKLHSVDDYSDLSQRLTKDLGAVKLMLAARQFKLGDEASNHLNLSLRGEWFGIEYLTGENVTPELRSFSLWPPGSKKAQVFNTPCASVLHSYVHTEFDGGFVQFDWYRKDALDEMKLHARAEF